MTTWVAEVVIDRTDLAGWSQRLFEAGASGLEERDPPGEERPPRQPWDRGPRPSEPSRVVVRAWFEGSRPAGLPDSVRWSEEPQVDWEAQFHAAHEPIVVSPRLTISPPWCAKAGDLVLEPGMGFGTGAHPTTRAALALMEGRLAGIQSVLDVGCGSGILALAAAHLGVPMVEGIDVERAALVEARRTARRNGLKARFHGAPVRRLTDPADLVLANLHAELLEQLGRDLLRLTRKWLIVAGVLADRESRVRATFEPQLRLDERQIEGEWVALAYERA